MTETVEQRAERIYARLEAEHGPGERLFAALTCDACGYTVKTASVAVLAHLATNWTLRNHPNEPDLCPNCSLARVTEADGGSRAKGSA